MRRGLFIFAIVFCSLILSGTGRAASTAGEGARASKFIQSMADDAISALTQKSVPREQRVVRFRALLEQHFAVDTIGRWVLGRYWNVATAPQRKEYLALFENLIVNTYVDRFQNYSGEKLTVSGTVPATGGDVLVNSQITRPAGSEPLKVSWRVRDQDGQLKIVDVIVAGVSMGLTQRSEFSSVIRQSGGRVEGLLAKLRGDLKKGA